MQYNFVRTQLYALVASPVFYATLVYRFVFVHGIKGYKAKSNKRSDSPEGSRVRETTRFVTSTVTWEQQEYLTRLTEGPTS
jgi:hypothetical protein